MTDAERLVTLRYAQDWFDWAAAEGPKVKKQRISAPPSASESLGASRFGAVKSQNWIRFEQVSSSKPLLRPFA